MSDTGWVIVGTVFVGVVLVVLMVGGLQCQDQRQKAVLQCIEKRGTPSECARVMGGGF